MKAKISKKISKTIDVLLSVVDDIEFEMNSIEDKFNERESDMNCIEEEKYDDLNTEYEQYEELLDSVQTAISTLNEYDEEI